MAYAWLVIRFAWSAAIIVYLVLSIIPAGRSSSWEKLFNDWLFVVVGVLVAAGIFARHILHGGLIFQFAWVLAGFAAAIGIPVRVKALVARFAGNGEDQNR
jgi:hypothetical protein